MLWHGVNSFSHHLGSVSTVLWFGTLCNHLCRLLGVIWYCCYKYIFTYPNWTHYFRYSLTSAKQRRRIMLPSPDLLADVLLIQPRMLSQAQGHIAGSCLTSCPPGLPGPSQPALLHEFIPSQVEDFVFVDHAILQPVKLHLKSSPALQCFDYSPPPWCGAMYQLVENAVCPTSPVINEETKHCWSQYWEGHPEGQHQLLTTSLHRWSQFIEPNNTANFPLTLLSTPYLTNLVTRRLREIALKAC